MVLLLLSAASGPSFLVQFMADHFEMVRVAAQAVVAEVVNLLLAGYVAEVVGVHDQVHGHSLAIE